MQRRDPKKQRLQVGDSVVTTPAYKDVWPVALHEGSVKKVQQRYCVDTKHQGCTTRALVNKSKIMHKGHYGKEHEKGKIVGDAEDLITFEEGTCTSTVSECWVEKI